jgi:hypothetical protein
VTNLRLELTVPVNDVYAELNTLAALRGRPLSLWLRRGDEPLDGELIAVEGPLSLDAAKSQGQARIALVFRVVTLDDHRLSLMDDATTFLGWPVITVRFDEA